MKSTNITDKIFSFHPYVEDQVFVNRQVSGSRQKSETVREMISQGLWLFKSKPKRQRTILRRNKPLGDSISLNIFEADAKYIASLVNDDTKTADVLREALTLSIGSKKAQAAEIGNEINNRLSTIEESLKAATEINLILLSRTLYGLEITSTILSELVADPVKFKTLYTQVQKQAATNLGETLTKLSQQEVPEWLSANLTDKIQKNERKLR